MKVCELLIETPQQIEDLDEPEFLDFDANRNLYNQLKSEKNKKLIKKLTPQASLYELSYGRFCVLDNQQKQVAYWMTFQIGKNSVLGKFVWQSLVWKFHRIHTNYTSGLPAEIFFKNLLLKFGTIITDSEQTFKGEYFWRDRIADAFSLKLNVYYFDFSNNKLIKLKDTRHLSEIEKTHDIWGKSDLHQMKRVVISNRDLENK